MCSSIPHSVDATLLTTISQNKKLSDDTDEVLALQGMNWFTRKAIGMATIYLHVKQYVDEAGITHIEIEQTATGGIKGTSENRILDWTPRPHEDHIFGKLSGKSHWVNIEDLDDNYLKEGWLTDDKERGGPNGELLIQNVVDAERGWTGNQVWGFAIIDGQRYYTRRVVVIKGKTVLKKRLVYTYQGTYDLEAADKDKK
jgi:hypothetical protein